MNHLVKKSIVAGLAISAAITNPDMAKAQKKTTSKAKSKPATIKTVSNSNEFKVEAESFADLQLLRYRVPGFGELPLQQKKLAYYLYEAALSGRDIIYDQK